MGVPDRHAQPVNNIRARLGYYSLACKIESSRRAKRKVRRSDVWPQKLFRAQTSGEGEAAIL